MKIHIQSILAGFLLVLPISTFSQNETNHWMFGTYAAIDFSSGAPVPESGCMLTAEEGTASISDSATGNLLMYTDGMIVYDANHAAMPNGTGLKGNISSTQAAIIVPQPESSTLFYIFTSDCFQSNGVFGYNYSVVDMTLNGGLGDVVASQKNVPLFDPSAEEISAVKHANCTDWWIMTKERGNNVYKAYLLTSTGVSGPIISTIGGNSPVDCAGQAKFSPDGTKYAICASQTGLTQLFDFDNATGLLSNPITLMAESINKNSYALSFSGDNSKLYVSHGTISSNDIYQYDLSSGVPATIIASATLVGGLSNILQFQLGKDFKIYVANYGATNLSVINNPNALGAACGFSTGTVPIAGNCTVGLPNFPDSYFNQNAPCTVDPPAPNVPEPEVPEATPSIPNVITPNGDGINDVFKIDNLPPASSLCIMNRWGNAVITTDNYNNDWMGNKSDGVYFYVLKTPKGKTFSGFVEVVTGVK